MAKKSAVYDNADFLCNLVGNALRLIYIEAGRKIVETVSVSVTT